MLIAGSKARRMISEDDPRQDSLHEFELGVRCRPSTQADPLPLTPITLRGLIAPIAS
jgi:hypothetical protein